MDGQCENMNLFMDVFWNWINGFSDGYIKNWNGINNISPINVAAVWILSNKFSIDAWHGHVDGNSLILQL